MVDKLTIQEIKESLTAVAMSKRLRKYHPDEPVTHTVVQRDRIKRLFDSYIYSIGNHSPIGTYVQILVGRLHQ